MAADQVLKRFSRQIRKEDASISDMKIARLSLSGVNEKMRRAAHAASGGSAQKIARVLVGLTLLLPQYPTSGAGQSRCEVLPSRKLAQTPGWHRQELLICTSALDHVFWKRASVATASSSLP